MRTALLVLSLLAVACTGDKGSEPSVGSGDDDDDGDDTGAPSVGVRIEGDVDDAGFGAALAASGAGLWAAAPFAEPAVVFALAPAGERTPQLELPRGGGVALGLTAAGDLLVGDPLTEGGRVLDRTGEPVLEGDGVGHAVGSGPRALGTTALVDATGSTPLPRRATSLAVRGDAVGVGFAFGDVAATLDGTDVPRPAAGDLAGFALAAGDVDGDGVAEWILGAPGAGAVHILGADGGIERTLTGAGGHFGAALAVADVDDDGIDDLLIGAPRDADDAGTAHLYTGGRDTPTASWTGEAGDRLGTAVGLTAETAVLGAPGGPGGPGAVVLVSPGSSGSR